MKCLLVSDLHYALKQYDWVTNASKDFDVVVIAGDHLDISSVVEPRAQIAVILIDRHFTPVQDQARNHFDGLAEGVRCVTGTLHEC